MGQLDGKVAIVTGSSRGIGKAVAINYAKEGARVVIAALEDEPLKSGLPGTVYQTAEEIAAFGGQALPIKTNVIEEAEVKNMVAKTLDKWGRIDVLVNNAGVASPGPFIESTTKRWNLVINVNLLGTYLCTHEVIPIMIKQGRGSIINTSSPAARDRTIPLVGVSYSVAKAAIEQFTHVVSAEIGKYNIAVNCYYPWHDVASEGLLFNLPPGFDTSRFVSPEYMVKAALFLAQQDGKGVTGTVTSAEEIILKHNL
jgi:NAD(P)-dependent dehydrogenase (short-subunit alcohol dehydrogenase family)